MLEQSVEPRTSAWWVKHLIRPRLKQTKNKDAYYLKAWQMVDTQVDGSFVSQNTLMDFWGGSSAWTGPSLARLQGDHCYCGLCNWHPFEHHSGCILHEWYPLDLCNLAILSTKIGLESGPREDWAKSFYIIKRNFKSLRSGWRQEGGGVPVMGRRKGFGGKISRMRVGHWAITWSLGTWWEIPCNF